MAHKAAASSSSAVSGDKGGGSRDRGSEIAQERGADSNAIHCAANTPIDRRAKGTKGTCPMKRAPPPNFGEGGGGQIDDILCLHAKPICILVLRCGSLPESNLRRPYAELADEDTPSIHLHAGWNESEMPGHTSAET